MLRLEFHCHTIYSKDSLVRLENLLKTCEKKGIDRIVISDHNTTRGAFEAQKLDPQRVIIGEEILTQKGELLAAYMKEEIPAGLTPFETIERLRDQEAFISVSHPFDKLRSGHWQVEDLLEIAPLVDAIEVFNARCMSPDFNRLANEFARQHDLAGTVGSDAHAAFELGRAAMLLPDFNDAISLNAVLPQAKYETRLSSPFVRFTSRYAVLYKEIFNPPVP
ncbi:MAG: PHP domain-containing protein [Anaerolineales bacterium]|nr:PHP domain-containing protein [Anaerolineales bacterium]